MLFVVVLIFAGCDTQTATSNESGLEETKEEQPESETPSVEKEQDLDEIHSELEAMGQDLTSLEKVEEFKDDLDIEKIETQAPKNLNEESEVEEPNEETSQEEINEEESIEEEEVEEETTTTPQENTQEGSNEEASQEETNEESQNDETSDENSQETSNEELDELSDQLDDLGFDLSNNQEEEFEDNIEIRE